jgi:proteasome lid subunit RPN8/RPN11
MLPQIEHRFVAEILRDGAAPITTGELRLDWIPALEWSRLQRIRASGSALSIAPEFARIFPRWDSREGPPYVSHVDVAGDDPNAGTEVIPRQYFAGAVQQAVGQLVADGKIKEGDRYRWQICAYQSANAAPSAAAEDSFHVEEAANTAPLPRMRDLSALLARAQHHGPPATELSPPDIPVLIAPAVLQEAAAAAAAAGTYETGGILLGKLARDAEAGDLVLQISAQIPAREAIADDASLRFTAATWRQVQAAISLRRDDEQILGWWHSHPAALWMCRNCPPGRRAACPSNRAFFSNMDVAFHRTAFQAAHNVALLLSFLDDPAPRFDLFGWRCGLVAARGYHTIGECS